MKTFSLLLAAGGAALASSLAVAGPGPAAPESGPGVQRTGSGDGAGFPGAPGGRAGAPGRVGGWSGSPAEREGLRPYCIGLLEAAPARSGAAGGLRPADCAGLFAAMAKPDPSDDEDEVPAPGAALAQACAALLKPGAAPRAGEPEACSDYVANLDAAAPRRAASGTGTGERAPDGPSLSGGTGGRGGRAGTGPGAGAGGAGGAGVGGGVGGAGGAGGSVR